MTEEVRGSREEELERIRQLEASPEYQEKLRILREKMKINIKWKMYKIALVLGIVFLFAMFKFVGIAIAAVLGFIFVYPVYKRKQELFREKKENNEVLYVERFLSPIVKEIFPGGEMKVKPDFLLDPVKQVFHELSGRYGIVSSRCQGYLCHEPLCLSHRGKYRQQRKNIEKRSDGFLRTGLQNALCQPLCRTYSHHSDEEVDTLKERSARLSE